MGRSWVFLELRINNNNNGHSIITGDSYSDICGCKCFGGGNYENINDKK